METTCCNANDKEKKQKINCFNAFIKATPIATNISMEPTLTLKEYKIYFTIIWIDTNFKTIEGYGSYDFDIVKKWLDTEFEIIDIKSIKNNTKFIQRFVNDLTDKLNAIINTSDWKIDDDSIDDMVKENMKKKCGNSYFDIPDHIKNNRDKYTYIPIGFKFRTALEFISLDTACARKCWKDDKFIISIKRHYKDLDESGKIITKEEEIIQIKENGHYKDWKPSQEDLDARDWYVYYV